MVATQRAPAVDKASSAACTGRQARQQYGGWPSWVGVPQDVGRLCLGPQAVGVHGWLRSIGDRQRSTWRPPSHQGG